MWNVFARLRLVAIGLGVLAAGSDVEASVLSLKAIKKNGVAVPVGQQSNLPILGGDTIEAEIFLSGWVNDFPSPSRVRIFQAKIDSPGLVSPDNGTALPLGWCAPLVKIECANPAMCPAAYPICDSTAGCTCAGHNPPLGAFITTSRPDFLLNGLDTNIDISTDRLSYQYYGLALDNVGTADTGVPRYLGTLILKIAANACGTFTINFVNECTTTFIADPAPTPNTSCPALQSLILTVSDCSRQLLSCSPNHCNIDARIATDRPNCTQRLNTDRIEMTFSKPTAGMVTTDFEITRVPTLPGDIPPTIAEVLPVAGFPNKATVRFGQRILQTRWTVIRDKGSNKRCYMGNLPADADDDRFSQLADTFEVFDNLQGALPTLKIEKCDTDRSLLCTGADLLMVADLLNGADCFNEVNGDSLDVCPAMRVPP